MVAVKHQDADRFLEKPPGAAALFLIFGTDAGLIQERARRLLRLPNAAGQELTRIASLAGDAVVGDPDLLFRELHSAGLFDPTPPAFLISAGLRNLLPILDAVDRSPPDDTRIVVTAGALKKTAPLRKWFEDRRSAFAIECYPDQPRDIRHLIELACRQADKTIAPDAVEALMSKLGEDRLSTRLEIEKLLLYVGDQSEISIADVMNSAVDAEMLDATEMVFAVFSGDVTTVIAESRRQLLRDQDAAGVALAALRHALALHDALAARAAGGDLKDSVDRMARMVNGFARRADLNQQLGASPQAAADAVDILFDLASESRKSDRLAKDRLTRALVRLAQGFARSRRKS